MSNLLWKDLPPEVLENVLACLPTHVLCRFHLVCKKWNHLFSQPSFAALRALSLRQASSILISPEEYYEMKTSTEWQIFDPNEKRSYKLSDSFIRDFLVSSSSNVGIRHWLWYEGWRKRTLATDGELIYTMYSTGAQTHVHIVCNPACKSFHEIPELGVHGSLEHYRNIVVMRVDKVTQTYKIVTKVMCSTTTKPKGQELFFLYESTTSAWRKLGVAPDVGFSAVSSIFMKGIFYTMFVYKFHTVVLYSCDLETSAWNKIDVNFPPLSTPEDNPQLVVSSGRLYMVKYTRSLTLRMKQSIWKIVMETKEVVQLEESENFVKLSDLNMIHEEEVSMVSYDLVAVGCVDSIIILGKKGHRMKLDLLEKRWQELPVDTLNKGRHISYYHTRACPVDF